MIYPQRPPSCPTRPLVSPKFTRVPQEGGWRRDGCRYVEGWWGVLSLKMKTFQVSKFIGLSFLRSVGSWFHSFKVQKNPLHVLLIDIDPILPNCHLMFLNRYWSHIQYQSYSSCFLDRYGSPIQDFQKHFMFLEDIDSIFKSFKKD